MLISFFTAFEHKESFALVPCKFWSQHGNQNQDCNRVASQLLNTSGGVNLKSLPGSCEQEQKKTFPWFITAQAVNPKAKTNTKTLEYQMCPSKAPDVMLWAGFSCAVSEQCKTN